MPSCRTPINCRKAGNPIHRRDFTHQGDNGCIPPTPLALCGRLSQWPLSPTVRSPCASFVWLTPLLPFGVWPTPQLWAIRHSSAYVQWRHTTMFCTYARLERAATIVAVLGTNATISTRVRSPSFPLPPLTLALITKLTMSHIND